MKHNGYTIEKVIEQTINPVDHKNGPSVDAISYKVSVGDKVVAVGLPSVEAAQGEIDKRCSIRKRAGLEPVG